MRLTDAVFGRMVVDVRSLLDAMPSEQRADIDGDFLTAIAEQPNEILKCAMYLFLGYLDGATQHVSLASRNLADVGSRSRCAIGEAESYRPQFAQSCEWGGSDTSLPWGRNPNEDDRRLSHHGMIQPRKIPKRHIGNRRSLASSLLL